MPAHDTKAAATNTSETEAPEMKAAESSRAQRRGTRPARPRAGCMRRVHAPDTAALDQGRARRPRMVPPAWHPGPGPEYAERAPRVGDTIPPGVPLYDLPPRYGAHYPPYPRGDDDYPPPRRFYGAPY